MKKDLIAISHINAQSVLCHKDLIEMLLIEKRIDILCISETWLFPSINDSIVHIPSFSIYRQDLGRGGGVCVYVRDDLWPTVINTGIKQVEGVEDIWLTNICLRNKTVVIMGDFSDNLLNSKNKMSRLIQNMNLTQIIDKPTRITSNSETLLDLIITNKPELISNAEVMPSPVGDHKVTIFNNVFNECMNVCAPFITKKITRPPAPWITNDVKAAMAVRDVLRERIHNNSTDMVLWENYKIEKKCLRVLIDANKKQYYKRELQNSRSNMKATWNTRKMVPDSKSISRKTNNNNYLKEMVENFNNFFANVESNSYGSDGISYRFIKDSLPVIVFYIMVILNTSIVMNTFPDSWKLSHVIPLHKGCDKDNVSNYRPISLLPIFSKVLEKIVANQLMTFLESQRLLSKSQYGFRQKLSTETALMKGSILGPIMFSIYVNDLSQCLSDYFVIQYADNAQLLLTGDVDNISELIAEAENVLSIVTGTLMYLNRIPGSFDTPTRVMVVQLLAQSMINYCSIIWGATSKEQMERVQKVQNFAAKVAIGGLRERTTGVEAVYYARKS
ncbi:uncharacterized protein [Penaeus vannamei]|uniref:uncharacterized protein n=1 Tax=Penaeus vannamei TaxID=6689 RepID=UPI00387FAF24